MRNLLVLLICILFFISTGCANAEIVAAPNTPSGAETPANPETAQKEEPFYSIRGPWDSAFNPHEVIEQWIFLDMKADISTRLMILSLGNPKLDWNDIAENQKLPEDVILPPGEIAKLMTYVFIFIGNDLELVGYGYTEDSGVHIIYKWNGSRYKEERVIKGGKKI